MFWNIKRINDRVIYKLNIFLFFLSGLIILFVSGIRIFFCYLYVINCINCDYLCIYIKRSFTYAYTYLQSDTRNHQTGIVSILVITKRRWYEYVLELSSYYDNEYSVTLLILQLNLVFRQAKRHDDVDCKTQ